METIWSLSRKIKSAEDLHGVVKTMKAMAAVSIRQYEKAVESLVEYAGTVEAGFQILLKQQALGVPVLQTRGGTGLGVIVFGSDQGMVGQFNDVIANRAVEALNDMASGNNATVVFAVGQRVLSRLEEAGRQVAGWMPLPGSVAAITPAVQDMVLQLEQWQTRQSVGKILLFHNRPRSGASYDPHMVQLLPVDLGWFTTLREKPWPGRSLPQFGMNLEHLFSYLIREYLFISLYRAFSESLAGENASRLAAMQVAEKNIEERMDLLNGSFHQLRQSTIDAELFDVIAGFEALTA